MLLMRRMMQQNCCVSLEKSHNKLWWHERMESCWFCLPFLDAAFGSSSLIDDALQELGLRDEYSLIGVVGCGDMIFVAAKGFGGPSPALIPPSGWWCELPRCGYHEVGLLGGQHESLIDWWRWLLFNKRNLS